MAQILFLMFAGGAAGLITFAIMEPFVPSVFSTLEWARWENRLVLLLGGSIGLAIGGAYGKIQGSRAHLGIGLAGGLFGGALLATLGHALGGTIASAIIPAGSDAFLPLRILFRVLALAPLGAFVGMVIGIPGRSVRRALSGAIGGLLGGAVGALAFDLVSNALAGARLAAAVGEGPVEIGGPGRAVYCVALGAGIGLCAGIVENLSRKAWVRLVLGRNEGKDWVIDTPQTYLGSSELAQVPLFGDPSVVPYHACILKQGGTYRIADAGSPAGTFVNGQRVGDAVLQHGDTIQIGSFQLQFLLRSGPAPVRGPEQPAGPYAMSSPHPAPVQPPVPTSTLGQPTIQAPQATTTVAGWSLVATDGPFAGQRFPIPSETEIGRESVGIPLTGDAMASRRHARLAPGPAGLVIQDLGSTNGTYINGQRVAEAVARPGDTVRIGATTFRVEG